MLWTAWKVWHSGSQFHLAHYNHNCPFQSHNCSTWNIFIVFIDENAVIIVLHVIPFLGFFFSANNTPFINKQCNSYLDFM